VGGDGLVEVYEGDGEFDEGSGAPPLRLALLLSRQYQSMQRERVALQASLRTRPIENPRAQGILNMMAALEDEIVRFMDDEAKGEPIYPWLSSIKGVGPRIGGMLIGLIDIERCPTVSSLWRFAGQAVIDGKAERRTRGEKLHYCAALKKTCYLLSRGLIMARNETYEPIYRAAKERYQRDRSEWLFDEKGKERKGGKLHVDLAAKRVMVKIFLQHLWLTWRELEGLPVSLPYAHAHAGHVDLIPPPPMPE
jgi:hypothetical protein